VNLRAIGCGLVAVAAFVGLGIWGLSLATQGATGCAPQVVWDGDSYRAIAGAGPELRLPSGAKPARIGTATVGMTTRILYGPDGVDPATDLLAELAVDCADGTYRAYVLEGPLPT